MIGTRRQRRGLNAAGFAVVVGLMSYALYAQHVLHLEACPLCIFQRIAMIAVGAAFALAALHAPRGVGARVYAVLGVLAALTGASISAWHVRLQNLPPEEVPSCGPGLGYMWDAFPLGDMLKMVFTGSGECAKVDWTLFGLAMPVWTLLAFIGFGSVGVWNNWRR